MSDLRIGIVCEGATDYLIFSRTLRPIAAGLGINVDFLELQPARDATSGQVDAGGWGMVFQWCTRNDPSRRRFLFETGSLFANPPSLNCDLLLVHLDSDICEEIAQSSLAVTTAVDASNFDFTDSSHRGSYIKAVLSHWLGIAGLEEEYAKRHILSPAVECSETWVLAGCMNAAGVESNRQVMDDFVMHVCSILRQNPPTVSKNFRKNPDRYDRYMMTAKFDANRARENCPHLDELCMSLFGV